MKLKFTLLAAMLAFGLAGCEQPAEQDEQEQAAPDTEAEMQSAPETQPAELETSTPEARDTETTTERTGETEEEAEVETDEPPPTLL